MSLVGTKHKAQTKTNALEKKVTKNENETPKKTNSLRSSNSTHFLLAAVEKRSQTNQHSVCIGNHMISSAILNK